MVNGGLVGRGRGFHVMPLRLISAYLWHMEQPWHLYLMAVLYFVAGIFHFLRPGMYVRIMPKYLPAPKTLVYFSGVAEMVLGIGLCIPYLKQLSLFGLILMLTLFLPVHWHMLANRRKDRGIPRWALILRIPLQFGLMYWAFYYL